MDIVGYITEYCFLLKRYKISFFLLQFEPTLLVSQGLVLAFFELREEILLSAFSMGWPTS